MSLPRSHHLASYINVSVQKFIPNQAVVVADQHRLALGVQAARWSAVPPRGRVAARRAVRCRAGPRRTSQDCTLGEEKHAVTCSTGRCYTIG
jgi:hypothetical protein